MTSGGTCELARKGEPYSKPDLFHVAARNLFAEDKEVNGKKACKIDWAAVRDTDLTAAPGGQGR